MMGTAFDDPGESFDGSTPFDGSPTGGGQAFDAIDQSFDGATGFDGTTGG